MRVSNRIAVGLLVFWSTSACLWGQGQLSIDAKTGPAGGETSVAIVLEGASKTGALDMEVAFPPESLSFLSADTGTIAEDAQLQASVISPGLLKIALVDLDGLSGDGEMILLKFKIKAKAGAVADIRIVSAMANHFEAMVEIPLKTTDGKLTVTAEKAGLALDTQSLLIGGGIGLAAVLLLVVLVARARKKS